MVGDVNAVVAEQRSWFQSGITRDMAWRAEKLGRLESVLIRRRDEICEALASDLGKPELEAYLAEYHFLLQEVRLIRRKFRKWLGQQRVMSPPWFWPCRSWIERQPYGVVLVIAPWNYPIQLSLSPLVAAIAAGNVVVLKPSELAPKCAGLLAEIIQEVFAGGGVAVVTGGVEVAEHLLQQKFDFIFFTGSTRVGREIAMHAAKELTPTVLELGGKCPCIVDAEVADMEKVVRRILVGKFFNAGQTCFAPDCVWVDSRVEDDFLRCADRLLERTPWASEMACVVSDAHVRRLLDLCEGKDVRTYGSDDLGRRFLAPRLMAHASFEDAVMQEEIFGPLLPVAAYKSEEELHDRLSRWQSPLALYVFSNRADFVNAASKRLPSGSLCVNDTMKQLSQLSLPLGGVGQSGHGRYRGRFGVETMSYVKSVTRRYFWGWEVAELIPPHAKTLDMVKKWLK